MPNKKIKIVAEKNASKAIYSHVKPQSSIKVYQPIINTELYNNNNYSVNGQEDFSLSNDPGQQTQNLIEESKATAKGLDSLLGTKTHIKDKSEENMTVKDSKQMEISPTKMGSDSIQNEDLASSPSNPSFNPGFKKFDSQQALQPFAPIASTGVAKNTAFLATPAVQRKLNTN